MTTMNTMVAPGDKALRAFTLLVLELDRRTAERPPSQRFSATTVPVEVLARLGNLLTDIANIRKSEAVTSALTGTVSVGQSVVKAEQAALEASDKKAA
jgi:hypothetical protein